MRKMIIRCPHCAAPVMLKTPTALTPKQFELLGYIAEYKRDNGYAPSFQEMADAVGLASKSGVHRLVEGLEERGAIIRMKDRRRAIDVTAESMSLLRRA